MDKLQVNALYPRLMTVSYICSANHRITTNLKKTSIASTTCLSAHFTTSNLQCKFNFNFIIQTFTLKPVCFLCITKVSLQIYCKTNVTFLRAHKFAINFQFYHSKSLKKPSCQLLKSCNQKLTKTGSTCDTLSAIMKGKFSCVNIKNFDTIQYLRL